MSHDKITQIRIAGLRAIKDLTLDLREMKVLIGDNGTGKSSILEALELLRKAAKPISFVTDIVVRAHGSLSSLIHRGSRELRLGVSIEGAGPKLDYDFTLGIVGTTPVVLSERVDVYASRRAKEPLHALVRDGTKTLIFDVEKGRLVPGQPQGTNGGGQEVQIGDQSLALPWLGVTSQPAFKRVTEALDRIELHVPFETRPLWQQRELDMRVGPRWPALIEPTDSLARYGLNLANAYQQLRNLGEDVWERMIERARLGLGDDVRNFRLLTSTRGNIELEVLFGSAPDRPLPAESLSDGQISYLAFIALVELNSHRSVLAFDEPDLHLHPALLARVVLMLEAVAETTPVILSTHSDRLLDALCDPAKSVVLCSLDAQRATQLRRPNAERLADWLQSYRGVGSIRAEGYESHLFVESAGASGP